MDDITPKEANEILSHYTDLGYGIVIEGEDTSKIKQALSLASKTLANGTPYNPIGDLICREALKKKIREYAEPSSKLSDDLSRGMTECACEILDMIDNASEIQPNWRFYFDHGYAQAKRDLGRPHGMWIGRSHYRPSTEQYDCKMSVCSECGEEFSYDAETGIDITDYSFCPKCGADMRKGDIDG